MWVQPDFLHPGLGHSCVRVRIEDQCGVIQMVREHIPRDQLALLLAPLDDILFELRRIRGRQPPGRVLADVD